MKPGRESARVREIDRKRESESGRARARECGGRRRKGERDRARDRQTRVSAIIDVDLDLVRLPTNLEKLNSQPPRNYHRSRPVFFIFDKNTPKVHKQTCKKSVGFLNDLAARELSRPRTVKGRNVAVFSFFNFVF